MNSPTIRIFGIPNCDSVKKARKWLDANDVSYEFHDYKKKGIDKATLSQWCRTLGWETLVNKRGTTWRKLPDADKEGLTQASAIQLMLNNISLIKRPITDNGKTLLAGFDEEQYISTFK